MIATATDHLGTGIPTPVREVGTKKITEIDTGPPRAHANTLPPIPAPLPSTWPEILDLAGRAAASGVRQWMHDGKDDPGGRPPPARTSVATVLALALSIVNVIALAAAIIGHQLGNSSFEIEMAAQRQAIYALIDVLAEKNPEVRSAERHLQR